MKRTGLGLSLSLVALSLLAAPALAESSPHAVKALSSADRAFLTSLAVPEQAPAPTLVASPPRGKSACSATASCGSGITIQCTGEISCSAVNRSCSTGVRGSVTCDGVRFPCTNPCP